MNGIDKLYLKREKWIKAGEKCAKRPSNVEDNKHNTHLKIAKSFIIGKRQNL